MKIYFSPPFNDDNEYIDNIINGLEHNGVDVVNKNSKTKLKKLFSIIMSLLNGNVKIYHFNWIENISIDSGIKATMKRCFLRWFVFIARFLGKKIVWTMHNLVPHKCNNDKDVVVAERFIRWWINNVNMIIVHASETADILCKRYNYNKSNILFVPHGKYEKISVKGEKMEQFRQSLNISSEDVVFTVFGIIEDYKNISMLIKVFCELNLENATLLICGKYSKSLSENNRTFIDSSKDFHNVKVISRFIKNNEVPLIMGITDVMVLPYIRNSMQNSGAAILALSYYKPMIVSRFGFIKDIDYQPFVFSYDYDTAEDHYDNLKNKISLFYENFVSGKVSINEKKEEKYVNENLSWGVIGKAITERYRLLVEK